MSFLSSILDVFSAQKGCLRQWFRDGRLSISDYYTKLRLSVQHTGLSALARPAVCVRGVPACAVILRLLRERTEHTVPFCALSVGEANGRVIGSYALLDPCAQLLEHGKGLPARATRAVGEARYFKVSVEAFDVWEERGDVGIVVSGVFVRDEVVVLAYVSCKEEEERKGEKVGEEESPIHGKSASCRRRLGKNSGRDRPC